MRRFVNQYADMGARVNKTNEEDAGTMAYGRSPAFGFETLKLATAGL